MRRLLIARITKKNEVLELGDTSRLQELIDFDAREPKQAGVLVVDPARAPVERASRDDNMLVALTDPKLTALGERFAGLTLYQAEAESKFLFTMN